MCNTQHKLTDERATYQTVRQIAAELHEENSHAGPGKGTDLATALEIARLQTENADLREANGELEAELGKLENELVGIRETSYKKDVLITKLTAEHNAAPSWAKAWKRAATVNYRARKRLQGAK